MKQHSLVMLLVMILIPASLPGQTWTSPDGFISVTPPDMARFQAWPMPPPPFLALWVSNDESMKFGVMKMDIPPNMKLIQSSVEEGLAEEIGGQVARLPSQTISGHEVWRMSAKSQSAAVSQAIIRHDSALYKVMAATVGGRGDSESVNQFIDSLSIANSATRTETKPVQIPGGAVDSNVLLHELSKKIGGLSCILLIGLVIYFFTRCKRPPSVVENA